MWLTLGIIAALAGREMEVHLPNNFKPRPYQRRAMAYLDGGGKRAVTVWHRRAGKDLGALHQTAKAAFQVPGQYWHLFPTFKQGRRAIWEGFTRDGQRIMEQVFPGFTDPKRAGSIVARKSDNEMFLELANGSSWRLIGTDNVENVGAGPKGVVFSEFALCRPTSWDFVRPMLRESGGWAWFITTPRGRNHAQKLYEQARQPGSGWFHDIRTVRDTGLRYASNRSGENIDAEAMMAEERAEGMPEALIRQEYLCDFSAALVGSVWGDLLEALEKDGKLCDFKHALSNVFTCWDLGIRDSTAVWWWRVAPQGVEILDYYENHGTPLSHYFDELETRRRKAGYAYAGHWLPHDAKARTLVTGSSVYEQAVETLGADKVLMVPKLSLLDGIQATRWLLQQGPRLHTRCGEGLEVLRQYHYDYDEDRKTFSSKPEHDWTSHGADAFRGIGVVAKVAPQLLPKPAPGEKPPDIRQLHNSFTLNELFDANEAGRTGRERI